MSMQSLPIPDSRRTSEKLRIASERFFLILRQTSQSKATTSFKTCSNGEIWPHRHAIRLTAVEVSCSTLEVCPSLPRQFKAVTYTMRQLCLKTGLNESYTTSCWPWASATAPSALTPQVNFSRQLWSNWKAEWPKLAWITWLRPTQQTSWTIRWLRKYSSKCQTTTAYSSMTIASRFDRSSRSSKTWASSATLNSG